jgi:hypothetical protein
MESEKSDKRIPELSLDKIAEHIENDPGNGGPILLRAAGILGNEFRDITLGEIYYGLVSVYRTRSLQLDRMIRYFVLCEDPIDFMPYRSTNRYGVITKNLNQLREFIRANRPFAPELIQEVLYWSKAAPYERHLIDLLIELRDDRGLSPADFQLIHLDFDSSSLRVFILTHQRYLDPSRAIEQHRALRHFVDGISVRDLATEEGVTEERISESLSRAKVIVKRYLLIVFPILQNETDRANDQFTSSETDYFKSLEAAADRDLLRRLARTRGLLSLSPERFPLDHILDEKSPLFRIIMLELARSRNIIRKTAALYFEGQSAEQIAEVRNIKVSTAEYYLNLVRRKINEIVTRMLKESVEEPI